MVEVWKDIIVEYKGIIYDFNGLYQISNYGRVKSLNYNKTGKEKILKPYKQKSGHLSIILYKNGKKVSTYVHRLVATCFIDNPHNYPVVNHKDENPSNNCVDNLEWTTEQYNTQYSHYKYGGNCSNHPTGSEAHRARKVMCIETGQVFGTIKEAQEYIGQKSGICECCKGKLETAGGYHWQYVGGAHE